MSASNPVTPKISPLMLARAFAGKLDVLGKHLGRAQYAPNLTCICPTEQQPG